MRILDRGREDSLAIIRVGFGRSGFWLLACVGTQLIWVLASSLLTGQHLSPWSPHLVAPVVLVLGSLVGAGLAQCWAQKKPVVPVAVALAISAYAVPIYANASAAVGALLLALAFMTYLDAKRSCEPKVGLDLDDVTVQHEKDSKQRILATGVGAIGFLMTFGSQAVLALAVPLLVLSFLSSRMKRGVPRWLGVRVGIFLVEMAAIAVLTLGLRDWWPSWLSAGDSLSSARHTLWSDALLLWRLNPVIGAGPGTFTESSDLASSTPHLAATHSSVLQVGAELGVIGVVLLAAIFIAGILLATRGNRIHGLIAGAAWTFLAIHSTIDHLEDFPVVALSAGMVLGWASLGLSPKHAKENQSLTVHRSSYEFLGRGS